jgi:hypothetical protein
MEPAIIVYLVGLAFFAIYLIIEPKHSNKYLSFLTMVEERLTHNIISGAIIAVLWPLVLLTKLTHLAGFAGPLIFLMLLMKISGADKAPPEN